jgi:hypothetical protein
VGHRCAGAGQKHGTTDKETWAAAAAAHRKMQHFERKNMEMQNTAHLLVDLKLGSVPNGKFNQLFCKLVDYLKYSDIF